MQGRRAARREAELQTRLAPSWPLYLKQRREDALLRQTIEAMQWKYREELAKRSPKEAQQQEREDAEINRDIEALDQRHREEQAKKELAKASETEARRRPERRTPTVGRRSTSREGTEGE